jgi:hypothetical protein
MKTNRQDERPVRSPALAVYSHSCFLGVLAVEKVLDGAF